MARLISIDLGARTVKVSVRAAPGHDGVDVDLAQDVPSDAGFLPSLADRLAALDLILSDHADLAQGAHVTVLTWPGDRATTHRMELPFGDDAQVAQTLPFAVEAEVPFDLDEMTLAWRRADAGHVVVTLARTDELEQVIDGLAARGLDPRRVVPAGEALAAWAREDVAAVVDVGHATTTVVVAQRGRALSTRSVSLGGRSFTTAVAGALGCTLDEATRLIGGAAEPTDDDDITGSFDRRTDTGADATSDVDSVEATSPRLDGLPPKAKAAMHAVMGLLLAEVRSTLVHAEDTLGLGIEVIYLTGGASRAPELEGFLREDLGLPVYRPERAPGLEVADGFGLTHGALDLAAGEWHATDLRVGDLAWKGGMDVTRLIFQLGGTVVGVYLAAMLVFVGWQVYKLTSEQADLEARMRAVVMEAVPDASADMEAGTMVELMAATLEEAQEQADFLGDENQAPPTVDLLHQLSTAFPPHADTRVQVDTLDITPGAIQIDGTTAGFAQVDRIGDNLTKAGLWPSVTATPGNEKGEGKREFRVVIRRTTDESEDTDGSVDEEG